MERETEQSEGTQHGARHSDVGGSQEVLSGVWPTSWDSAPVCFLVMVGRSNLTFCFQFHPLYITDQLPEGKDLFLSCSPLNGGDQHFTQCFCLLLPHSAGLQVVLSIALPLCKGGNLDSGYSVLLNVSQAELDTALPGHTVGL